MEKLRIVFMGTPDFAVPALRILHENDYPIAAVVTAPDKPAGRGLQLQASAVKKFALEHHIPLLQPDKLKSPLFIEELRSYNADLQVVVAFRMLPEVVWNMPPLGTINLHASLLPDYRGAAPINWAIINGEKTTGLTTFFLQHTIDTGDIIMQRQVQIEKADDAGSLHDKMMHTGAELVLETVRAIENNTVLPLPQKQDSLKSAPKLFREDCLIQWNRDAEQVLNFIRGLSPYPGAYTFFDNRSVKIFRAHKVAADKISEPGTHFTDGYSRLTYSATNGNIAIDELQIEGKKRMTVEEFLRGYRK